jgi:hypothetical protein
MPSIECCILEMSAFHQDIIEDTERMLTLINFLVLEALSSYSLLRPL